MKRKGDGRRQRGDGEEGKGRGPGRRRPSPGTRESTRPPRRTPVLDQRASGDTRRRASGVNVDGLRAWKERGILQAADRTADMLKELLRDHPEVVYAPTTADLRARMRRSVGEESLRKARIYGELGDLKRKYPRGTRRSAEDEALHRSLTATLNDGRYLPDEEANKILMEIQAAVRGRTGTSLDWEPPYELQAVSTLLNRWVDKYSSTKARSWDFPVNEVLERLEVGHRRHVEARSRDVYHRVPPTMADLGRYFGPDVADPSRVLTPMDIEPVHDHDVRPPPEPTYRGYSGEYDMGRAPQPYFIPPPRPSGPPFQGSVQYVPYASGSYMPWSAPEPADDWWNREGRSAEEERVSRVIRGGSHREVILTEDALAGAVGRNYWEDRRDWDDDNRSAWDDYPSDADAPERANSQDGDGGHYVPRDEDASSDLHSEISKRSDTGSRRPHEGSSPRAGRRGGRDGLGSPRSRSRTPSRRPTSRDTTREGADQDRGRSKTRKVANKKKPREVSLMSDAQLEEAEFDKERRSGARMPLPKDIVTLRKLMDEAGKPKAGQDPVPDEEDPETAFEVEFNPGDEDSIDGENDQSSEADEGEPRTGEHARPGHVQRVVAGWGRKDARGRGSARGRGISQRGNMSPRPERPPRQPDPKGGSPAAKLAPRDPKDVRIGLTGDPDPHAAPSRRAAGPAEKVSVRSVISVLCSARGLHEWYTTPSTLQHLGCCSEPLFKREEGYDFQDKFDGLAHGKGSLHLEPGTRRAVSFVAEVNKDKKLSAGDLSRYGADPNPDSPYEERRVIYDVNARWLPRKETGWNTADKTKPLYGRISRECTWMGDDPEPMDGLATFYRIVANGDIPLILAGGEVSEFSVGSFVTVNTSFLSDTNGKSGVYGTTDPPSAFARAAGSSGRLNRGYSILVCGTTFITSVAKPNNHGTTLTHLKHNTAMTACPGTCWLLGIIYDVDSYIGPADIPREAGFFVLRTPSVLETLLYGYVNDTFTRTDSTTKGYSAEARWKWITDHVKHIDELRSKAKGSELKLGKHSARLLTLAWKWLTETESAIVEDARLLTEGGKTYWPQDTKFKRCPHRVAFYKHLESTHGFQALHDALAAGIAEACQIIETRAADKIEAWGCSMTAVRLFFVEFLSRTSTLRKTRTLNGTLYSKWPVMSPDDSSTTLL